MIWAGAGLSAPAGLPTWLSLRDTLFQAAEQKLATLDDEGQKRTKALVELAKTETSVWSAFAHLRRALGDTTWITTIRNTFQNASSVTIPQTYLDFWELGPKQAYWGCDVGSQEDARRFC